MPRIVDREARRAGIVSAAAAVFAEKGVANTTVSDIVKAAGVAQGTFYLYFETKDDIVLAVVEQFGDRMLSRIEGALADSGASAIQKLAGLRDVLVAFDDDPAVVQLAAFIHHRDNIAVHDRLAEHLTPRLLPLVESIVAQGVAEGVFDVPDVRAASWFVLGGLQSVELSGTGVGEMPAAIAAATELALRVLGHREAR